MTIAATTGVQHREVVVIGGGQAGLAVAVPLLAGWLL
jgi:cation diffusion facilitator CzcD-associated flavoprotein CzcO